MALQPIGFRGRLAASASIDRFFLAPHIEVLEDDHPDRRFVSLMCWYARDVLTGLAPGPYNDRAAEFCVRSFLIDDDDFALHWRFDDALLAERYAVPLDQVTQKRLELHSPKPSDPGEARGLVGRLRPRRSGRSARP